MNQLKDKHILFAMMIAGSILPLSGCNENARLADHEVRAKEVQTITAYGRELNQAATPVDVVYVFAKAVLDDYDAGDDQTKREEAFDVQLGTLATEKVKREVSRKSQNEQQILDSFFMAARRFAPVVGHYRETFREDYQALTARMFSIVGKSDGEATSYVLMNLDHPDPEQRTQGNVIAKFNLVRENGYWRIWWVGFDNTARDWKQKTYQGRPLVDIAKQQPDGKDS